MKKIFGLVLFTIMFSSKSASGQVEVLNQFIRQGESWTVPAGRVALVSHAATTGGGSFNIDVRAILPGLGANDFVRITTTVDLNFGPRTANPIPFVSGTRFENPGSTGVVLFGRLASPTDLFACIEANFQEVAVNDGQLKGKLVPKSKRPARISMEKSSDLASFQKAESASIVKNAEGNFDFIVPANEPKKFIRVKVQAKPGS